MRTLVVVWAVAWGACGFACATDTQFHAGPTSLNTAEQRAMLTVPRSQKGGFQRFWLRPGCELGVIKWSEERSQMVPAAPAGLLELIRDELGRLNSRERPGEVLYVSVTVFEWRKSLFGLAPKVGYEVVGRDRAGQVIWMAEDRLRVPRDSATSLAEGDEQVVARSVGAKLRAELGL